MTPPEDPPFYVGYQKQAPAGLSRHFRALVAALGLVALILGFTLAARQQPAGPGRFEFGRVRSFHGRIQEGPSPVLWVDRGEDTGAPQSSYDLVAAGKHGTAEQLRGWDGRWVRLSGALVNRPGRALIEVVDGSVVALSPGSHEGPPARQAPGSVELGAVRLVGEIVDAKCWAGVMKPGRGKPHRDCAARCIAGGIPAVFVVEAIDGSTLSLDLVDEEGFPVGAKLLDRVAEPLIVEGRVSRVGDRLILRAGPTAFRRLPSPRPNP